MQKIPKPMVEAEVCGTCVHYHQHYTMGIGKEFHPLWYGHCGFPRLKSREPDKTCPRWKGHEEEPASRS